ncbi:unnamed protein product [Amoebophrya sp. A25]|nr:unnamed protein product [Amoebophrya sp. A25]|eukprot:GSA25T00027815001.1
MKEIAGKVCTLPAMSEEVSTYLQKVTYAMNKANCYDLASWTTTLAPFVTDAKAVESIMNELARTLMKRKSCFSEQTCSFSILGTSERTCSCNIQLRYPSLDTSQ